MTTWTMSTTGRACMALMLVWATLGLGQEALAQPSVPPQPESSLQVNINQADAETIADVLVGVGLSRAQAIVDYREEHGPFTAVDELIEVKGIGEATLRSNLERIRLE